MHRWWSGSHESLQRIRLGFDSLPMLHNIHMPNIPGDVVFPMIVGVVELAAGVRYAYSGKWALAVAWVCYGFAAVALALADMMKR